MRVVHTASLDEKTVQKVARGAIKVNGRTRKVSKHTKTQSTTVDQRVWQKALELTDDPHCITRESHDCVIVWNSRQQLEKMRQDK